MSGLSFEPVEGALPCWRATSARTRSCAAPCHVGSPGIMRFRLDLRPSSATPSQLGRSRLPVPIVKVTVQLGATGSR